MTSSMLVMMRTNIVVAISIVMLVVMVMTRVFLLLNISAFKSTGSLMMTRVSNSLTMLTVLVEAGVLVVFSVELGYTKNVELSDFEGGKIVVVVLTGTQGSSFASQRVVLNSMVLSFVVLLVMMLSVMTMMTVFFIIS